MIQLRYISELKTLIHALPGIPWERNRRADMKDIGRILREQRVAIGLEIGDIAKKTCISSRYLCAMEEGRFQNIPGVYGKGYLKIYADLLHLDLKPLLALYEQDRQGLTADGSHAL
jgi:cytoskeletal protein RodZ